MVAIDWSDCSKRALALAKEVAKMSSGELRLVHVHEMERLIPSGSGPLTAAVRGAASEQLEEQHKRMEASLAELAAAGIRASGIVRPALFGHVAPEILKEATESHSSLVVVGTRGLSVLEGILLGSTAQKLLHLAEVPILIAP